MLSALHSVGLILKLCKCKLPVKTVDYLDHLVHICKLTATEKSLASVRRASIPQNHLGCGRSFASVTSIYDTALLDLGVQY